MTHNNKHTSHIHTPHTYTSHTHTYTYIGLIIPRRRVMAVHQLLYNRTETHYTLTYDTKAPKVMAQNEMYFARCNDDTHMHFPTVSTMLQRTMLIWWELTSWELISWELISWT